MNGFQIDRRICFSALVLEIGQLILPCDDLLRGDVAHRQPAEVGNELRSDNVLLGLPGIRLNPGLYVQCVLLYKAAEHHFQIQRRLAKLITLPRLRLSLGLKSSFL